VWIVTCLRGFFSKYLSKAENGWNHSKAFTLQNFPEPIKITSKNGQILQLNCLRCHRSLVHEITNEGDTDSGSIRCVHCHRAVGHGETVGLGGPEQAGENEQILVRGAKDE
jgi:cytochrome c nitrite reductase small subunit